MCFLSPCTIVVCQARHIPPQSDSADTRGCVVVAYAPWLHVCLYNSACLHFVALCLLVIQLCICRQRNQECSMQQPPTPACTAATKAHTRTCRVSAGVLAAVVAAVSRFSRTARCCCTISVASCSGCVCWWEEARWLEKATHASVEEGDVSVYICASLPLPVSLFVSLCLYLCLICSIYSLSLSASLHPDELPDSWRANRWVVHKNWEEIGYKSKRRRKWGESKWLSTITQVSPDPRPSVSPPICLSVYVSLFGRALD